MTPEKIKSSLLNLIRSVFPELAQGTHLPMKGKVLAVHGEAGTPSVQGGPRYYSVDIAPLQPDGTPDESRAPLKDVPLDVPFSGAQQGVFCLPTVGSLVRVGFYGGSAAHPYVDGILPDGHSVPEVPPNMLVLQIGGKTLSIYKMGGNLLLDTDANLIISAPNAKFEVLTATIAGNTRAVAMVGSEVTIIGTDSRGGPITATGTIASGSSKVRVGE